MKYIYLTLLFILFFASLNLYASPYKVVIDPGHGGTDAGAVAQDSKESDITLDIAKKVFNYLKKDANFQPILTRNSDQEVSLDSRSQIAKNNKADLFISIHANSSVDTSANGAEVYFQSQMPPDEETLFLASRENESHENQDHENQDDLSDDNDIPSDVAVIVDDLKKNENIYNSQILAETIISEWKKKFRLRHEPIKQGPFRVLVHTPIPSILIEVGFVTNNRELRKLKDNSHQNQIAQIIYKSIKDYKEKIDKSEFSSHIVSSRRQD